MDTAASIHLDDSSADPSSSTSLATQSLSTTPATSGSQGTHLQPGSAAASSTIASNLSSAITPATNSAAAAAAASPSHTVTDHATNRAADAPLTSPISTFDRIGQQISKALELKEQGNALFSSGDRLGAMTKWHHALLNSAGINSLASQYGSKSTEEQNKQGQAITMAVQNNLASCYLADRKYEKVIYATSKVLALDESNVKALYRRAKAYKELGDEKKAAKDLDEAMTISPKDTSLRTLAMELVKMEEAKLARQKKLMNGFLKGKSLSAGEDDINNQTNIQSTVIDSGDNAEDEGIAAE